MKNQLIKLSALALIILATFAFTNFNSNSENKDVSEAVASYEFQQVSVIESVVAAGVGRSRILSTGSNGKMNEEKILNLFSIGGINLGNIHQNDVKVSSKLSTMSAEGWELVDVTTGVSMYGQENEEGIYMTRFLFRRAK